MTNESNEPQSGDANWLFQEWDHEVKNLTYAVRSAIDEAVKDALIKGEGYILLIKASELQSLRDKLGIAQDALKKIKDDYTHYSTIDHINTCEIARDALDKINIAQSKE